jgi:hypothetical protein
MPTSSRAYGHSGPQAQAEIVDCVLHYCCQSFCDGPGRISPAFRHSLAAALNLHLFVGLNPTPTFAERFGVSGGYNDSKHSYLKENRFLRGVEAVRANQMAGPP